MREQLPLVDDLLDEGETAGAKTGASMKRAKPLSPDNCVGASVAGLKVSLIGSGGFVLTGV